MRIDLGSLDPTSPLARRVREALARDEAAKVSAPDAPAPARVSVAGSQREDEIQRCVVAMLAEEAAPGVIAFHVPNGGKRGKAEAGRFNGMGVVAGIPDLIVIAGGRAYGLELKTPAGRLSAAQKEMRARFIRAGCEYEVARSVEAARRVLAQWGAIGDHRT
jgi:hypothetical protein